MASFSTNQEIIEAVTNLMDPVTQTTFQTAMKDGVDLNAFSNLPMTVLNEFLKTGLNKIMEMRVYDPLRFDNPFAIFETESPAFGAIMELDAVDVPEVKQYDENATVCSPVSKPKVKINYLYTRDKIVVDTEYSEEQIRGMFLNQYGLATFYNQLTKKLFDARNLFLYEAIKKDLYQIEQTKTLSSNGVTDATAKGVYQEIVELVYDMQLPSDEYNGNGLTATLNSPVLVLNTATSASFDVNVSMSLFNYFNSSVTTEKLFNKIIRIKDTENTDLIGYILDGEKYVWSNRILEIRSFYDGASLKSKFWLHNWIIRGLNQNVDGVKLVIEE